ncbi:hypothetical protein VHEMI06229 [[Torrubiella] hemipterigena]|uniref:Uncharacterized protein n=1 Tax=[Torrubiella] hemipterigena TaxID=1531966 RepID=A0A0A1TIK2_9HYPO|nr:hypothetical protein VHEMI06229 [[Torrubiella] hemipterigena]
MSQKTANQTASVGQRDAIYIINESFLSGRLIAALVKSVDQTASENRQSDILSEDETAEAFTLGLAALQLFLQINVTGPVVPSKEIESLETKFASEWTCTLSHMRRACLKYLAVDGLAPYPHIPYIELFCLAKYIFTTALTSLSTDTITLPTGPDGESVKYSLSWTRLRIHAWHYKLIAQPSFGGANFTKSSQWSELPTLAKQILDLMESVRSRIMGGDVWAEDEAWNVDEKVEYLLESANNYILLGRSDLAKSTIKEAAQTSGLSFALSGALGKRTRFQEKSISQMVVLAKSNSSDDNDKNNDVESNTPKPQALPLNNDTLLEEVQFAAAGETAKEESNPELPPALAALAPDNQPQLNPLDQIILLAEATLKDAFSPVDSLTAEEILPFATRVIADKSTNWQIYTQALLVRSRIEVHRSRTMERGILQLQALADQVLSDTTYASQASEKKSKGEHADVPSIEVSAPGQDKQTAAPPSNIPTTFLPAPTASESAPADIRLRYIHALSTPPRWHLESELAFAWASVGSLISAQEIFQRLRLWAEVALCLASAAAAQDDDGRGSGGDDKARGIVRWRLFYRTGQTADVAKSLDQDEDEIGDEVTHLKPADFAGPERSPPPSDAARLWCILGDLEQDPNHYERAWELSNRHFSRAQRSLGEYYIGKGEWAKAQEAYKKATAVNRMNPEMWGRLGDISLRLNRFEDAAEAFTRSIGSANDEAGGEDAKTWSNLGSALWSLCAEVLASGETLAPEHKTIEKAKDEDEDTIVPIVDEKLVSRDPAKLLAQALAAFKKGASIANDNWRIWENVVTLAARMRPPAIADMVLAMTQIVRIRKTEDAVNADVLNVLLQREVLLKARDSKTDVYEPPRGTTERLISRMIEEEIAPLITKRSELWSIVSRLRAWHRDYHGAIDAAERAWRAAFGSSGSSLLAGESSGSDWTEDEAAWMEVVKRTDELVSVLENWGPDVEEIGARWRGKARSAVRSVMGRAKQNWQDTEGWATLEGLMEGLKLSKE